MNKNDDALRLCPFCGGAPRYLEGKTGFWSERVICDSCHFHLPPEKWNVRAENEAQAALLRQALEALEAKDGDWVIKERWAIAAIRQHLEGKA